MGTDTSPFEAAIGQGVRDEMFEVLSNATRRRLLAYLNAQEGPTTFDELVMQLSTTADDADGRSRATDPDAVAVRLHHSHLPKLQASGLVEVSTEPTGRTVRGTGLLDQVATEPLFPSFVE